MRIAKNTTETAPSAGPLGEDVDIYKSCQKGAAAYEALLAREDLAPRLRAVAARELRGAQLLARRVAAAAGVELPEPAELSAETKAELAAHDASPDSGEVFRAVKALAFPQ